MPQIAAHYVIADRLSARLGANNPAFVQDGTRLVMLQSYKQHCSLRFPTRLFASQREAVEAAIKIAELDPSGAYVLAYDAARKSVAAALLTSGYRVLSRPGSHQALAQYAASIAIRIDEPALNRFDRLRRNRNRSEYGSRTFGKAEVAEAIDTARAIRAACASLV